MTDPNKSTEDRLGNLQAALEARSPKPEASVAKPISKPAPVAVGPKTRLTLKMLRWALRLFWAGWVVLAIAYDPSVPLLEMAAVIVFSAVVCWLLYQFYKALLLWPVRKSSKAKHGD